MNPTLSESLLGVVERKRLSSFNTASSGQISEQENSSEEYPSDIGGEGDENRVSASSKVNFSKLSAQEKYFRCKQQAYQIKQLRRKLRNLEKKGGMVGNMNICKREEESKSKSKCYTENIPSSKEHNHLIIANEALKKYSGFELEDSRHLLSNLSALLLSGRLRPDSLQYSLICSMVRSFLVSQEATAHYRPCLDLPWGKVPIGQTEYIKLHQKMKGKSFMSLKGNHPKILKVRKVQEEGEVYEENIYIRNTTNKPVVCDLGDELLKPLEFMASQIKGTTYEQFIQELGVVEEKEDLEEFK